MSGSRSDNRFACRAVLREVLTTNGPFEAPIQEHLDGCAFCAERLEARSRLVPLLKLRPSMPVEPIARQLEDVHERAIDAAELGPLGGLLTSAVPMPAADLETEAWPESLLAPWLERQVAAAPAATPGAWPLVRASILQRLQTTSSAARRRARQVWIGLAGAAAVTVVLGLTWPRAAEPPRIVFQDITELPGGGAPAVDFAVIRYGAAR